MVETAFLWLWGLLGLALNPLFSGQCEDVGVCGVIKVSVKPDLQQTWCNQRRHAVLFKHWSIKRQRSWKNTKRVSGKWCIDLKTIILCKNILFLMIYVFLNFHFWCDTASKQAEDPPVLCAHTKTQTSLDIKFCSCVGYFLKNFNFLLN